MMFYKLLKAYKESENIEIKRKFVMLYLLVTSSELLMTNASVTDEMSENSIAVSRSEMISEQSSEALSIEHYHFDKTTSEVSIAYSKDDPPWVKEMYSGSGTSNLITLQVISKILGQIYLGPNFLKIPKSQRDKVAKIIHDQIGITHILDCTMPYEDSWLKETDLFECCHLPMVDNPPEKLRLDEAIKFIDGALSDPKNKIYIHCQMGASRSSSIVIGYLIHKASFGKDKSSFDAIYNFVKEHRPSVNINSGFETFLRGLAISKKQF
jgi:atypical dual specificity phosphatase